MMICRPAGFGPPSAARARPQAAWRASRCAPTGLVIALSGVLAACAAEPSERVPPTGARTFALHPCSSGLDSCDDGNLCTVDNCRVGMGVCMHVPRPGCCHAAADCDDEDPCTLNQCASNRCTFISVVGCTPDAGGPATEGGIARSDAGGDAGPHARASLDVRGGACTAVLGASMSRAPAGPMLACLLLWGIARRRRTRARLAAGTPPWLAALAALTSLIWPTGGAHAQPDFRLADHTAPALPEDLFWLERASPALAAGDRLFVRLDSTFVDDPMVAIDEAGDERAIVAERLGVRAVAGATVFRRAHLSLGMPVWVQRGDGVALDDARPTFQPKSPAVGDASADLRVDLLQGTPVTGALAVGATFPIGSAGGFSGDRGASLSPRLQMSIPLGVHATFVGANAGLLLRPSARVGPLRVGSAFQWIVGGQLGITRRIALSLELVGATVLARAFDGRHTPFEGALGVWHRGASGLHLGLGLGTGLSAGFGAPDARVFASLGYRIALGAMAATRE